MALAGDKVLPIALMDEENKIKTILLNAKGQITIFFATTVLVLITFIAFIVNIGIFVKAKINLQNAVDAAAYAGASVQARQLSNIAYLNWEMRNVYKEWMFKTYVLGNLSLTQVSGPSTDPVKLTMDPFNTGGGEVQDGYNVPSVCLDFSASGNVAVCKKALIPGLPRFSSTDVLGMEETMDAFVDALSGQKADDCAQRSNINFLTNFIWAYNVPDVPEVDASDLSSDAPEVAANRSGAFPAAFDLALRIRSLEAQVNRAPYSGVCGGGSAYCNQRLDELVNANGLSPADERVYKAFQSAWRNLGGTNCDAEGASDELKCSFTLTELAPQAPDLGGPFSLSNLLIPSSRPAAMQKRYLDLKLMPVNYATFYTMLAPVSTANGINASGLSAEATAECVATKVGMPVPGYPLGYVKNPDVLTYYAVKGEGEFVGLFNPFQTSSIKLTAFAAAKPFGGRIGPMLFNMNHSGGNPSYLMPRAPHFKTSPYVSALDNTNPVDRFGNMPSNNNYQEGMPIPGNYNSVGGGFWLKDETSPIGGWIDSQNIFFAVPNLPYDYPAGDPADFGQYFADNSVQIIKPLPKGASTTSKAGLYNSRIFEKLKANLAGLGPGSTVTVENINNGILLSRAPTKYDALNYMVPTPEDLNRELDNDSYGVILNDTPPVDINGNLVYQMSLYAPLMDDRDPNALYRSVPELVSILEEYTSRQEPAVLKYRGAMNLAAKLIFQKNYSSRTGGNYGISAANAVAGLGTSESAYTQSSNELYNNVRPGCKSINGKFVWFFTGNSDHVNTATGGCDPKNTLKNLMQSHWNTLATSTEATYHTGEYILPAAGPRSELFSAYRPGEMNDADANGEHTNFLSGQKTNMSRNFYSSKFMTLKSVTNTADEDAFGGNFALFSEGQRTKSGMNDTKATFKNYLLPQALGIDLSEIRH